MKHFANITSLAAGLLLLTSCTDDNAPGTELRGDGLTVGYRIDSEMPLSRGVTATDHETTLGQVHLLFFDRDDDTFKAHSTATVFNGSSQFSIDAPDALLLNKPYRVLAIGNGDSYISGGSSSLSSFLETFTGTRADAKTIIAECEKNVTKGTMRLLPLYGTFVDESGNELTFTKTTDGAGIKVAEAEDGIFLFSRAICRVDIHNLVGHILDIRYARIANNRTAGYYFLDGLTAGSIMPMTTNYTDENVAGSELYMPVTTEMIPGETTTQRLEASLYTFPNIVGTTVQNDKVTTCLLIAGYYTDPETNVKDTELTFYRFNLANVGESQTLQRNYAYQAVIKGVKRRGASDEKGAYDDTTPIFEYNVDDEWDTTGDNVVSDENGNFLIVNKTHFTFNGEATDADFVELKVSTNPELSWHVEEVSTPGHSNSDFIFEQLSKDAVKCGPHHQNTTNYVRYGYYKIVANSATTSKPLEMYIYLMQLSTQDNIKMLSVNGSTGTIHQKIPAQGGIVTLKVVTGTNTNSWVALDEDNDIVSWDKDATWTKSGGNNQDLQISIPANISGATREAKLKVMLSPSDDNVQPVYIVVTQDNYDGWYTISPMVDGPIRINAFSVDTSNPNGVMTGTARGFTVTLTDPTYKFKVETTFNEGRDVRLSVGNHLENLAVATHDKFTNSAKLTDLPSGTTFYVNPFRTGPGDPTIRGEVKVTVYDPAHVDDPEYQRTETLQFHIVSGNDYDLNDVILLDATTGGRLLVADRNAGHKSRVKYDGDNNPIPDDPFQCLNYSAIDNVYINRNGIDVRDADEAYNDTDRRHKSNGSLFAENYRNELLKYWLDRHKDEQKLYSPFYLEDDKDKWEIPLQTNFEEIMSHMVYTKWRVFLVSDVKKKIDGKEVPVVCWFHQVKGASCSDGSSKTGYDRIAPYAWWLRVNTTGYNYRTEAYYMNTSTHAGFTRAQNPYNWNGATTAGANITYRLVREITEEELQSYKQNYLGY